VRRLRAPVAYYLSSSDSRESRVESLLKPDTMWLIKKMMFPGF